MDTDLWAWLVTVLGAFTCVTASGGLAVSGIASPPVARKLLHTGRSIDQAVSSALVCTSDHD